MTTRARRVLDSINEAMNEAGRSITKWSFQNSKRITVKPSREYPAGEGYDVILDKGASRAERGKVSMETTIRSKMNQWGAETEAGGKYGGGFYGEYDTREEAIEYVAAMMFLHKDPEEYERLRKRSGIDVPPAAEID